MALSHFSSPLIHNSPWYVVSIHWFSKWLKYIHSSEIQFESTCRRIGPIDNSSLYNNHGLVDLDSCIEGIDYVTVPTPLWKEWCTQFGVLPCAISQVVVGPHSSKNGQAIQLCKVLMYHQLMTTDGRVATTYRVEAKPLGVYFSLTADETQKLLESHDASPPNPHGTEKSSRKRHRDKSYPCLTNRDGYKQIDWSPYATLGLLMDHIRALCQLPIDQPMRLWYSASAYIDGSIRVITDMSQPHNLKNGDNLGWQLLVPESGFHSQYTLNSLCLAHELIILVDIQLENGDWTSGLSRRLSMECRQNISSSSSCANLAQRAGLCGLTNMGNTCYMNSSLQCLSHVMPLVNYFLNYQWRHHVNIHNILGYKGKLASMIHSFFKVMWSGLFPEIQPSGFKNFIEKIAPQFSGNMQHDCQEILSFLLDGLHEDLNRVPTKPFRELPDSDGRPDEIVAEEWINYLKSRDDSIITDLFRGFLKSTVTCTTCGHTSVKFDPFTTLNLPIPTDKERLRSATISTPPVSVQRLVYLIRLQLNKEDDEEDTDVPNNDKSHWITSIPLHFTYSSTITVHRLIHAICRRENIRYHELIVTEVSESRILRILQPNDSLATLSTQRDIFIYHLPELKSPSSRNRHICLVHQFWASHPLGIPFVYIIPSVGEFNCRKDLLEPILRQLDTMCPAELLDRLTDLNITTQETQNGHIPLIARRPKKKRRLSLDSDDDTSIDESEDTYTNESDTTDSHIASPRLVNVTWCSLLRSNGVGACNNIPLKWSSTNEESNEEEEWLAGKDINNPEVIVEWDHEAVTFICPEAKSLLSFKKQVETSATKGTGIPLKLVGEAPPDQTKPTLENCLEAFLQPETLDETNTYYCKRCKSQKIVCKKMDLWELPEILILHFKRVINPNSSFFTNCHTKQMSTVIYPVHKLDMSQWILAQQSQNLLFESDSSNHENVYDLIAVANHYGRLNFGHYTTTLKHEPLGQWFEFDDESVTFVRNENALVTSFAYLLVYQRRSSNV